jgi:hypothetical protein
VENPGIKYSTDNTSITQGTRCVKSIISDVMWKTLLITWGKRQVLQMVKNRVFHREGGVFHRL